MCAEEPRPKEPYESEPGFAFASATSSSKVFAGTEACTAMTHGKRTSTVIGVKLFRPLYGSFLYRGGLITNEEASEPSGGGPSGTDLDTYSAPTIWFAP